MGPGLAASDETPLAGQARGDPRLRLPAHDPNCYLCAGNLRANGARNPDYPHTFVFDNDFAALAPDAPDARTESGLLIAEGESGVCRVLCFSPRHDLTIAMMEVADIERVVDAWVEETITLGGRPDIGFGADFREPRRDHGLLEPASARPDLGDPPSAERNGEGDPRPGAVSHRPWPAAARRLSRPGTQLEERIVAENAHFVTLAPFWAIWPFETMILPRRRIGGFDELTAEEKAALAEALSDLTQRYDRLFDVSFPYSMGFHQRPTDGAVHSEWQMHAHFYPPLLRSATVKKFMVGFEMLGSPQRDLTPEAAAARLRDLGA